MTLFDQPGTYEPRGAEIPERERGLGFRPCEPISKPASKRAVPRQVSVATMAMTAAFVVLHSGGVTLVSVPFVPTEAAEVGSARGTAQAGGTDEGELTSRVSGTTPRVGSEPLPAVTALTAALQKRPDSELAERRSMHEIMRAIDTLMCEGEADRCSEILPDADVDRLTIRQLLALATVTLAGKHILPERPAFLARLRARLLRERPTDADALLAGLC